MKLSVFIAKSLDGYIARPDGGLDWLMAASSSSKDEDYGYKSFFDSIDCMIVGRATMEMVAGFGEWPYEGKRVIVLSNKLSQAPPALSGKIELYTGSLHVLVQRLQQDGHQHAYVDGGKTIQSFINAGFALNLTITTIPILIGDGLPLFGKTASDIPLAHRATQAYANGFVQSQYVIAAAGHKNE